MEKPKEIINIYDLSSTFDRYTIVTKWKHSPGFKDMLALSSNPNSPQGVSQWTSGQDGNHLGKKISWNKLPANLQDHVIARLTEN